MSEQITVARPYAKAAFEFAVEHEQLDAWQKMLFIAANLAQQESIQSLMTSNIRSESIAKMFIDLCGDELDVHAQNFIKVMAENRRLSILPEVFSLYEQYKQEKEAVIDVELISAAPLTSSQLDKISSAVEKRLSRKVILQPSIDNSIIAGFIVRAGDFVIDNSIRGQLTRLSNALQS